MPYERPGAVVRATAGVDVRHGAAAADNGFVGRAVKTKTPASDLARASRDLIVAGEEYNLRLKGVMEIPTTGITGGVKGDLVYIDPDDNALALAQAGNNVVLGKIHAVAGEHGCQTGKFRVSLDIKS